MDDGLLGPAEVREFAARLGIRPTKSLGQNFVVDPNTVRRIVRLAEVGPGDCVLEVGPGLGSLTLGLLDVVGQVGAGDAGGAGGAVVAVEVDPVLAAALPSTIEARRPDRASALTVLAMDALRLGPADLATAGAPAPTALVANLPYNVAVPVVLHLLETVPTLERALVMVQSEVADRMAAPPGNRTYGVPSVKLAWYGEARRAGAVGRAVFWPVPNVDSALVAFTRGAPPPSRAGRAAVFAVVDAAFAQRRKMLRSALAGLAGSTAAAADALERAGVDPTARGEQLGVAEYAAVADQLATALPAAP